MAIPRAVGHIGVMASKKPPKPPSDGPEDDVAEPRDTMTASMFADDTPLGPPAYQVLARKYRPTRFEDLVGQEAMVRTLTNAFKTGRIAHAFMLTGVRGVGKTTTARLLARALNYETKDVHQPFDAARPAGRALHLDHGIDASRRAGAGRCLAYGRV